VFESEEFISSWFVIVSWATAKAKAKLSLARPEFYCNMNFINDDHFYVCITKGMNEWNAEHGRG
jgi:hypothetical protein